jgi:hypothetical protein
LTETFPPTPEIRGVPYCWLKVEAKGASEVPTRFVPEVAGAISKEVLTNPALPLIFTFPEAATKPEFRLISARALIVVFPLVEPKVAVPDAKTVELPLEVTLMLFIEETAEVPATDSLTKMAEFFRTCPVVSAKSEIALVVELPGPATVPEALPNELMALPEASTKRTGVVELITDAGFGKMFPIEFSYYFNASPLELTANIN